MNRFTALAVTAIATLAATPAFAAVVSINSIAALNPNDQVIWNGAGFSDGSPINSDRIFGTPATWTSDNGVTGTISASAGSLRRRTQGINWAGQFNPGEFVIYQPNSENAVRNGTGTSEPVTIRFDSAVQGFGFHFNNDFYNSAFSFEISAFDATNALLADFTFIGTSSNGAAPGTADFVGMLSDAANIASIRLINVSGTTPGFDSYGINQMRLVTNNTRVPEPASLALLGLGLAGLAASRRKRA